jgi:DNA-binding IclR family transcriptional regulator
MGKLFLSMLPPRKRAELIRALPLQRYTESTMTDAARLDRELDKIRALEISTDNQEFLAGVVCVAVPVYGRNGQPVAAVAISAPLARMTLEQGLRHVALLQDASKRLSATLDDEAGSDRTRPESET